MKIKLHLLIILLTFLVQNSINSQVYPDQQFIIKGVDQLKNDIESSSNISFNYTNNCIELDVNSKEGYFTLKPFSFEKPFNRGLPSWNGFAPKDQQSSFKVLMRYKMTYGWSKWVTVGFWDKNIWSNYGDTIFSGGKIDIDYTKLDQYVKEYQFKVLFKRNSSTYKSPNIKQLSFSVSDSKTTDNVNINAIINDKPPEIFIPTTFVYQYDVDDDIGGSICSPTTTSMIIKSYDIEVDTYQFSVRTKDPYWGLYGVWPRVVQHAAEYGLEGSVTRYRTWSEVYEVLKNDGRIAMTLGPPLFRAHLIMLAGFDSNGTPILHNPGSRNGYAIVYDKKDITESWFNKGGISYTFYKNSSSLGVDDLAFDSMKIYPNPFKDKLNISIDLSQSQDVNIKIYNLQGQCVYKTKTFKTTGNQNIQIDLRSVSNIPSGIYLLHIIANNRSLKKRIIYER